VESIGNSNYSGYKQYSNRLDMPDIVLVISELIILQCALSMLGVEGFSMPQLLGIYILIKLFLE
jgi:hypothetical protein